MPSTAADFDEQYLLDKARETLDECRDLSGADRDMLEEVVTLGFLDIPLACEEIKEEAEQEQRRVREILQSHNRLF